MTVKTTGHNLYATMKEKLDKRETLLEAGSAVMLRKGYNGTGVQEIVRSAGVPKGSFYNYFKSKQDFLLAAMEYRSRPNIVEFETSLSDKRLPPAERIVRLFQSWTDAFQASKIFTLGCFVGNMCQEMADTDEAVAEKAEYLFRYYTAALARCIRELQESNPSSAKVDPDKLADFIFNSWEGALLRMKSSRNTQPLSAFIQTLKVILSF